LTIGVTEEAEEAEKGAKKSRGAEEESYLGEGPDLLKGDANTLAKFVIVGPEGMIHLEENTQTGAPL